MQTVAVDPAHKGDGEWALTFHVSDPLHYAEPGLCEAVEVLQPFFAATEKGASLC